MVSPEAAAGLVSTEVAWRRIDDEFGLLEDQEAEDQLRRSGMEQSLEEMRVQGTVLAIVRKGNFRFPGFQFDSGTGAVLAIVPRLLHLVREHNRSEKDLTLWICSPTTYLAGARPVDHFEAYDLVLTAAEGHFGVVW